MDNQNLKVVLVGCGGMSGAWLKPAAEIEGLHIVGLVDVNLDAARKRADEFGLASAVISHDLSSILDQTSADIVFDCSTPTAHANITTLALEHGCHVLGEKPLADSMDNARRSVAAAKASGLTYAVMQNRRFDWRIQRLRRLVRSGQFGDLTTLHSDFFLGVHFGGFRDHMRHVLLLDMAIHTFDAARFILDADPISVWAKEWNPAGSWYDHDASAVAFFQMSNGIVYTYRGSWCSEGLNTTWETDWRLIGSKGSIKWDGGDGLAAEKAVSQNAFQSELAPADVPDRSDEDKDGGHSGLIKDFIDCIRSGRKPETDCSDNIKSLAMVFGAIESSETGKEVQVSAI
jgi:predicted dehydrogenase